MVRKNLKFSKNKTQTLKRKDNEEELQESEIEELIGELNEKLNNHEDVASLTDSELQLLNNHDTDDEDDVQISIKTLEKKKCSSSVVLPEYRRSKAYQKRVRRESFETSEDSSSEESTEIISRGIDLNLLLIATALLAAICLIVLIQSGIIKLSKYF